MKLLFGFMSKLKGCMMKEEKKKIRLGYVVMSGIIALLLIVISCRKEDDRDAVLRNDITVTKRSADITQVGYAQDVVYFRLEAEQKFMENDSLMAAFKQDLEREKKSGNSYYVNHIRELEEKNRELKNRIDTYANNDLPGWEKFKEDFTYELTVLHEDYKSLGIRKKR